MSRGRILILGGCLLAIPIAGIVAACTSAVRPALRQVPPTVEIAIRETEDDSFTVVFIGDPEARMRGNTAAELGGYVDRLLTVKDDPRHRWRLDDGRTLPIEPELVIIGGDISSDRSTSIAADLPIWQPILDQGVPVLAGFGNHDWEPESWGDSPSYSFAGHRSNESTIAFTRETYRRSAKVSPELSYREIGPTSDHGPLTFLATYKGVDIVNFNTFLYQPSYRYPDGWPITCNPLGGGAGCQEFVGAEPQIAEMDSLLGETRERPAIFTQHYPLSTGDRWWSDYGSTETSLADRKERLLGLMAERKDVVFLAGHNHRASAREWTVGDRRIPEHVAPYFGDGGGFIAVRISPTRGVLAVRNIEFK